MKARVKEKCDAFFTYETLYADTKTEKAEAKFLEALVQKCGDRVFAEKDVSISGQSIDLNGLAKSFAVLDLPF